MADEKKKLRLRELYKTLKDNKEALEALMEKRGEGDEELSPLEASMASLAKLGAVADKIVDCPFCEGAVLKGQRCECGARFDPRTKSWEKPANEEEEEEKDELEKELEELEK